MRGKKFVIATIIMVFIFMGALSATGKGGQNEQLKEYYKDYIAKCISKNQSKAGLQASKSANLRSCGVLSQKKVIFLTNNQNMLVNEMIEKQVGKKPYKIEHYLNERFFQAYR
jgi:hypothetical protein